MKHDDYERRALMVLASEIINYSADANVANVEAEGASRISHALGADRQHPISPVKWSSTNVSGSPFPPAIASHIYTLPSHMLLLPYAPPLHRSLTDKVVREDMKDDRCGAKVGERSARQLVSKQIPNSQLTSSRKPP